MSFVEIRSDSVKQRLELILGQSLGGVVRVQGSEKVVDLRRMSERKRDEDEVRETSLSWSQVFVYKA